MHSNDKCRWAMESGALLARRGWDYDTRNVCALTMRPNVLMHFVVRDGCASERIWIGCVWKYDVGHLVVLL